MSAQVGSQFLQKFNGGMGILLGGVPEYQKVKYLSSVAVKSVQMAKIALGLGANVTILDVNPKRLAELDDLFDGRVNTIMF